MTFYVDNEIDAEFPFDIDGTIKNAIEATTAFVNCEYNVEVNVLITDAQHIRDYNREYRDIDKETDVLSFPAVDYEKPADFSIAKADKLSYFNPETDELVLGDIILCKDRIYSQAEEYGHSVLREFTFLVVHSMLHLFGFDHMTKEDEEEMFLHQESIMQELGILR